MGELDNLVDFVNRNNNMLPSLKAENAKLEEEVRRQEMLLHKRKVDEGQVEAWIKLGPQLVISRLQGGERLSDLVLDYVLANSEPDDFYDSSKRVAFVKQFIDTVSKYVGQDFLYICKGHPSEPNGVTATYQGVIKPDAITFSVVPVINPNKVLFDGRQKNFRLLNLPLESSFKTCYLRHAERLYGSLFPVPRPFFSSPEIEDGTIWHAFEPLPKDSKHILTNTYHLYIGDEAVKTAHLFFNMDEYMSRMSL